MVQILIAVAISTALLVGLLCVVRQRLARQFANIERRLLEVERVSSAIEQQLERSTPAAELQRLHLGMVRLQENIARRYGPLLSLADGTPRRRLTEFQRSGLQQWAAAIGAPCDAAKIDQEIEPGKKAEVEVTVPSSGDLNFYCRFHRGQGMQGALIAKG